MDESDVEEVIIVESDDEECTHNSINDISCLTFTRHQEAVFTCDTSGNGQIVATGGQDDYAYVWDITCGEVLLECTGHKDSVCEVAFNNDSTLLATADMAGVVQIWCLTKKTLVWYQEVDDIKWLFWHSNFNNVLFCGCESGQVYIWQIPEGKCKILPTPTGSCCTCAQLISTPQNHLLTSYSSGDIKLWNLKQETVVWSFNTGCEVTNLATNSSCQLMSCTPTGHLIKMTNGKQCGLYRQNEQDELEAVIFNDDLGVLITGSIGGFIAIWDVSRQQLRHQIKIECAVTVMKPLIDCYQILVGCADGIIYQCDLQRGIINGQYIGHQDAILCMSLAGSKLVSGSEDRTTKIFELGNIHTGCD